MASTTDDARLLAREDDGRPDVSLRWDRDTHVVAKRGDTVSLALLDAGIVETSRSPKYRRPRGAYCLRGDCGTCLVRIAGLPNRRACLTTVREGLQIEPQNMLVSGPDPTALVDTMMRGDIDHHHMLVRPRVVNQIMQGVARNLAGLGTLPDRVPDAPARHEEHRPDVLVVGAGPAGRAAHEALLGSPRGRSGELDVVWIDRFDREGLQAQAGTVLDAGLLDHTGVFGVYPEEALWAAMSDAPDQPSVLRSIYPRHVVLATGARDPTLVVPNNDRPGVVSARGLVGQLTRTRSRLRAPIVLIGEGDHVPALEAALDTEAIAPGRVKTIDGTPAERVLTDDGTHEGALVALAPRPAPAYDLARQAGAGVRWSGGGFAVARDEHGVALRQPWTLWVAGDVGGYVGPAAAADDGTRVAKNLLEVL